MSDLVYISNANSYEDYLTFLKESFPDGNVASVKDLQSFILSVIENTKCDLPSKSPSGFELGTIHFENLHFHFPFVVSDITSLSPAIKSISLYDCQLRGSETSNRGRMPLITHTEHINYDVEDDILLYLKNIDSDEFHNLFTMRISTRDLNFSNIKYLSGKEAHSVYVDFNGVSFDSPPLNAIYEPRPYVGRGISDLVLCNGVLGISNLEMLGLSIELLENVNLHFKNCVFHCVEGFQLPQVSNLVLFNCTVSYLNINSLDQKKKFFNNIEIRQSNILHFTISGIDVVNLVCTESELTLSVRDSNFLSELRMDSCVLNRPPDFYNSAFPTNTSIHDCCFNGLSDYASYENLRNLRMKLSSIGNEHDARFIESYEFESRYNKILKDKSIFDSSYGFEKLSSFLLKHIHNYGRDIWKPLLWLLYGFVFFFVIYGYLDIWGQGVSCVKDQVAGSWIENVCTSQATTITTYSLTHSLGPLGLIIDSGVIYPVNGFVKFLEVTQLIISSLLWFFFVVSLRRRFKV